MRRDGRYSDLPSEPTKSLIPLRPSGTGIIVTSSARANSAAVPSMFAPMTADNTGSPVPVASALAPAATRVFFCRKSRPLPKRWPRRFWTVWTVWIDWPKTSAFTHCHFIRPMLQGDLQTRVSRLYR